MKIYITGFLIFCSVHLSIAQSRFGLLIGGGVLYYTGEMNDRVLTHEKLLRPYGNIGLMYRLSNRFDVWANYMHGTLVGNDSLAIKYVLRNRNLNFQTTIDEVGIYFGFHLLGAINGKHPNVIPYLFAGVTGYHFQPKSKLNGKWMDLQSIGTEGQYIKEGNYPKPYELYQVAAPAGIGVEFRLSKALGLRVEAAHHFLFTDYLDDVSGNYPDSSSLAATPRGEEAVLLSSHIIEGGFPQKDVKRGDVKTNDSFTHIGIALLWTPLKKGQSGSGSQKKKKKKKHCDAYH